MTAPADTAAEVVEPAADTPATPPVEADEMRVTFPLLAIEGYDTADGRFITAGAITARTLPLTLLAQTRNSHGGQQPEAAHTVGRIDTLERVPGPDVVSKVTGEPFPEGTFVWRGTGVVSTTKMIEDDNVSDLIRRRYLRGLSADLVPSDYELYGNGLADPANPTRKAAVHKADLGGATVIPIPAFGDCCIEIGDQPGALDEALVPDPTELGLVASAFPAWRSAEVGDYPTLVAAGEGHWPAAIPPEQAAVAELAGLIADDNGQQRDATELAAAIVQHIREQWATGDADTPVEPVVAAAPSAQKRAKAEDDGDTYPGTDKFPIDTRERAKSAIRLHGSSDLPAEKVKAWLKRRLKAKGWDDLIPESWSTDSAALAAEPAERPDDMGMPDAPQTCEYGDHPAERSLIYRDGERYVATCTPDEDAVREWLAEEGETVTEVVEIEQAEPESVEEMPA